MLCVFQDGFAGGQVHQAQVPRQTDLLESLDDILVGDHVAKAHARDAVRLGQGVRGEGVGIFLHQLDLRGHFGVIGEIGFVDAGGDSGVENAAQIAFLDEDAGGIVGIDDDDQLGLGRNRRQHGVNVVLQIAFAQRHLDGDAAADAGAHPEQGEGRRGQQHLVSRPQENAHHVVDDFRRAIGEEDVLGAETAALADFLAQVPPAVRIAVAVFADVGDRVDHLFRRRNGIFIEHQPGDFRMRPDRVQNIDIVFQSVFQPRHEIVRILRFRVLGHVFLTDPGWDIANSSPLRAAPAAASRDGVILAVRMAEPAEHD